MKRISLALILMFLFATNSYAGLEFDGTNDYVIVPDHNNWDILGDLTSNRTVEFWVNLDRWDYLGTANSFFSSQWDYAFPYNFWCIVVRPWGTVNFMSQKNNTWIVEAQNYTVVTLNEWHHVAVVKQGASVRIGIDGILGNSYPILSSLTIDKPLQMGREGISWGLLDGTLDEVRIWDTALTEGQLQYWMGNTPAGSNSNLLAYWNFDEGDGQVVHDLTSYGNNGYLGSGSGIESSDPTWSTSGAPIQPVPEPATMLLFGLGGLGFGIFRRKRLHN